MSEKSIVKLEGKSGKIMSKGCYFPPKFANSATVYKCVVLNPNIAHDPSNYTSELSMTNRSTAITVTACTENSAEIQDLLKPNSYIVILQSSTPLNVAILQMEQPET